MSLLLKGGTCLVVVGGACTIPFLNFNSFVQTTSVVASVDHSSGGGDSQTNSVTADSPAEGLDEESTFPPEEVKQEAENCSLNAERDEVISLLPSYPRFVAFSCDNSGKDDSEINAKWTIWLPVAFLNGQNEDWLLEGRKIEIKTNTSNIENEEYSFDKEFYKTTFESDSFVNKKITGEWGRKYFGDNWSSIQDDSYVWTVTVTDPKTEHYFIYLRLTK